MKVHSIRIENFRSIKDETIVFNDYTCLVGPNGVGKSTVLIALNLFFQEFSDVQTDLKKLNEEDFYCKNVENPIEITITFKDLSAEAQEDFSDYYRQEELVVSAKASYSADSKYAEIKHFGQRLGMKEFAGYFNAEKERKSADDLKDIYTELQEKYSDLPNARTKEKMQNALHDFESSNKHLCELIPSEDHFYGISKGKNRLVKYIQWIYVPAVKDATSEQIEENNSSLGKLLDRTVHSKININAEVSSLLGRLQKQYQGLLDDNQNALQEISKSLQSKLTEWAHPEAKLTLEWKQDPNKSVRVDKPWAHIITGESGFEGELSRFGHGFQRSYLLALLQELAESNSSSSPTLLLGCEEPEIYQHPPQIRHFANILQELSEKNSQIILCTHSPLFVSGQGFESIRMFNKTKTEVKVGRITIEKLNDKYKEVTGKNSRTCKNTEARLHQLLQPSINEMFFTRRLVLVEGLEDFAYLQTWLFLKNKLEKCHRIGAHIVPTHGKSNMITCLIIAIELRIPTYVIFDADSDKINERCSKKNIADNKSLLKLLGCENQNPTPDRSVSKTGFTMWHSDIGSVVQEEIGSDDWEKIENEINKEFGETKNLRKNHLHIGHCLQLAFDRKKSSCSLERVCNNIVDPDQFKVDFP